MGRDHPLSGSRDRGRETWTEGASTTKRPGTKLIRSGHLCFRNVPTPQLGAAATFAFIATVLFIGISLGTAALSEHSLRIDQVGVSQDVVDDAVAGMSPAPGDEAVGWGQLWSPAPTAAAIVGLASPSTPLPSPEPSPPTPTPTPEQDDRAVLAARSDARDEASPTPAPTRPLTFEEQFIAQAAEAAQSSQRETGVPASVTIAQAILESDWGRSKLSLDGKNYFGIKATVKEGNAGVVWIDTREVINGQSVTVREPFRAYQSMADSFVDHGRFFLENARYAQAMKVANDPIAFAREIQRAGYATDPGYSDKLIALMNKFNLQQYDLQ